VPVGLAVHLRAGNPVHPPSQRGRRRTRRSGAAAYTKRCRRCSCPAASRATTAAAPSRSSSATPGKGACGRATARSHPRVTDIFALALPRQSVCKGHLSIVVKTHSRGQRRSTQRCMDVKVVLDPMRCQQLVCVHDLMMLEHLHDAGTCVMNHSKGASGWAGAGPTGDDGGRDGGAPPAEAFCAAAAAGARQSATAAGADAAGAATAGSACGPASAGAAGGCAVASGAAGASAAVGAAPGAAAGAAGSAAAGPAELSAAAAPAGPSAGGAAAAAERCVASCGMSCMSGTPALTMRAMNSSASMVSELVLIVSMKEAAEYCAARAARQPRPGRIPHSPARAPRRGPVLALRRHPRTHWRTPGAPGRCGVAQTGLAARRTLPARRSAAQRRARTAWS